MKALLYLPGMDSINIK